jgi:hypothetical protein
VLRVCPRLVPTRMDMDVSSSGAEEEVAQQEQAAAEARVARLKRSQVCCCGVYLKGIMENQTIRKGSAIRCTESSCGARWGSRVVR